MCEGLEAASGGTDPRLSPGPDVGSAAKSKFRFVPELGFGARVHTRALSEDTRFLLSVFLQVSVCLGKNVTN